MSDPGKTEEEERESPNYEDKPTPPNRRAKTGQATVGTGFITRFFGNSDPNDTAVANRRESRNRQVAGIVLAGIGLGSVYFVVKSAFDAINQVLDKVPMFQGPTYFLAIAIAAHALISLGTVWFAYQMLRAAERMFLPQRLLQSANDVELVRALIGIDAPTSALANELKALLGTGLNRPRIG